MGTSRLLKQKQLDPPSTGMCVLGTPVEDHFRELGLSVKREDLCCPLGPHFSKTRGVYAHIAKRSEAVIGCLDTGHSQGGWATATACSLLGKGAVVFYPVYKKPRPLPKQQEIVSDLGHDLVGLPAGRSAVLYHAARKRLAADNSDSYMMPNALKLIETVTETAAEFKRTKLPDVSTIVVSASSATIAAGVYVGALKTGWKGHIVVHMGYERPRQAVLNYMSHYVEELGGGGLFGLEGQVGIEIVDERYAYRDEAKPGPTPPFACNAFYDLKAFRWWMHEGRKQYKKALFWNIG